VNDVELEWMGVDATCCAWPQVEVGLRERFAGSSRGFCRGPRWSRSAASWSAWDSLGVCDVIEVDPARRVKLRIEYERLAEMHPSDLAEILEDLAPAERAAVLPRWTRKWRPRRWRRLSRSCRSSPGKAGRGANRDIVEEMDPGAAADLLAELPEEQSDAILEEMEPEERQEVEDLLEFDEDSAAGCMTTDFIYWACSLRWPRRCMRCGALTAIRRA